MSTKAPNQKLTNQQIATIKELRQAGVSIATIASVLHKQYGMSVSAAYYHLSDNREAYDYQARKEKEAKIQKTKERIYAMIAEGLNTKQIAESWNMDLAVVNKIYTRWVQNLKTVKEIKNQDGEVLALVLVVNQWMEVKK